MQALSKDASLSRIPELRVYFKVFFHSLGDYHVERTHHQLA
jgi:hypothetical protein